MESDKYLSNLLICIFKGLNYFFSSVSQRNMFPMLRKKLSVTTFKNGHSRMIFIIETKDENFLFALYKYCSQVEYNDFMLETSFLKIQ